LLDAYFESDKEVLLFCEHLFRRNKQMELHWKIHEEWGNHIQVEENLPYNELISNVAWAMAEVYIAHRLGSTINHIIEKYYYFSNAEEIERIHDIAIWIFAGEDEDSLSVRKKKSDDPKQLLHSLFIGNIKQTHPVHYDSIVKFGLKVFRDHLIHLVGLAIDEFKREEEHQEFVNSLREYIAKKRPGLPIIHILQGETFSFFKDNGKRLTNIELRRLMKKEPLYIVGLDEDELNLGPLIAMVPKNVKIYGEDPSDPKTLTVINVFQEKAQFESIKHFPFSHYLKNESK
jgi:putative sporulation protein YtxC